MREIIAFEVPASAMDLRQAVSMHGNQTLGRPVSVAAIGHAYNIRMAK